MKKSLAIAISTSIALTGCASQPKPSEATSASTNPYDSYTCEQLVAERHRIQLQRIDQIQIRRSLTNVDRKGAGLENQSQPTGPTPFVVGIIRGALGTLPNLALGIGQKLSHDIESDEIRDRLVADNEAVKQAAVKKNCIGPAVPDQKSPNP